MKELKDVAANYAAEKTNELISNAIAQAYADGYRDGYRDREEEIPVDLRDNKTEYVDLGLPSGTLWAKDYETKDDDYIYVPYEKAVVYEIPTMEQCNELFKTCKWKLVAYNAGARYRIDCIGPNGRVIHFYMTGIIKAELKNKKSKAFFWIREDLAENEKYSVKVELQEVQVQQGKIAYIDYETTTKVFSGYKLPIRLVRKK